VGRQLGDRVLETGLRVEGGQPERPVDHEPRLAGLEGGHAVGHEADLPDLVLRDEVGVPAHSAVAGGVVVRDGLAVGRVRLAPHLADQHLAHPVVVLEPHVDRDARLEEVSAGVALGELLGHREHLVERLGRLRGIEPGLGEELLVPEEGQRADGGRHRIVLAVHLHLLHEGEEVPLDVGGGEHLRRQGLEELRLQVVVEPAVEELDDVGPLAGRDRRRDLQPEVVVGHMGVLDLDARVLRLESLDELVDGLDTLGERVLPVLDLHGLGAGGSRERDHQPDSDRQPLARRHRAPPLRDHSRDRQDRSLCRVPGGRCSQSERTASTREGAPDRGEGRPPC
jgi:hypothetical protein